jgi:hypothetical protein
MSGRDDLFGSFQPSSGADHQFGMLISEHESIRNSEEAIDTTLEVGLAASDRLFAQSLGLSRSNANLQTLIGTLPGARFFATKIQVKRKCDRLILGSPTMANIEPPGRASTGAPSMISLLPRIAPRPPRQVPRAETP